MSGPEATRSAGGALVFPIPYVSDRVESREERAKRIQPAVAGRVTALGVHAVAARTGLSKSAVAAFADGFVTPLPGSLDAYEEMLKEPHAPEHGAGQHGDPRSTHPTEGGHTGGAILVSGG